MLAKTLGSLPFRINEGVWLDPVAARALGWLRVNRSLGADNEQDLRTSTMFLPGSGIVFKRLIVF